MLGAVPRTSKDKMLCARILLRTLSLITAVSVSVGAATGAEIADYYYANDDQKA